MAVIAPTLYLTVVCCLQRQREQAGDQPELRQDLKWRDLLSEKQRQDIQKQVSFGS